MLYYTSLLFSTVIVHAHLVQDLYILLLFNALTCSSIMYHLMYTINHSHTWIVKKIDMCLAFQSVMIPMYLNWLYVQDIYVYLSGMYVPLIYSWNTLYNQGNDSVHATLHIIGTFGIHRLLYLGYG
jgi:hypothetical protein